MTVSELATRHLLVVANRTCPCAALRDAVLERAARDTRTLIVAPALNRRLAHWLSDTDGAVQDAHARLDMAVSSLCAAGLDARGVVGDADPFLAVADALVEFPADELIISSWPPGRSNWLEKDLVRRVREQHQLPVHHVVSDFGLEDHRPDADQTPPLSSPA